MTESLRDIVFEDDDDGCCERCGGEGYIMAADGDASDWQEDTYCGPLDAEIKCRVCNGTGSRAQPNKGASGS